MAGNEAFHAIAATVDYPMYVVTAAAGEELAGCLVGFASQGSIDPPRFVVCLSKANHTYRVAQQAPVLAVHLLAAADEATAALFGSETGDEVDKFARCRWSAGPSGVPVLEAAVGWFAGRVVDRVNFGDHMGHVLAPLPDAGAAPARDTRWYSFHQGRRLEPGHPA